MDSYICKICGYIYAESKGQPNAGIPPNTNWTSLPSEWCCPQCAAGKECFERQANKQTAGEPSQEKTMVERVSAACENLTHGIHALGLVGEEAMCRVTTYLRNGTDEETIALASQADQWLKENYPIFLEEFFQALQLGTEEKRAKSNRKTSEKWKCSICGHIHNGPIYRGFHCPACKQPANVYYQISDGVLTI